MQSREKHLTFGDQYLMPAFFNPDFRYTGRVFFSSSPCIACSTLLCLISSHFTAVIWTKMDLTKWNRATLCSIASIYTICGSCQVAFIGTCTHRGEPFGFFFFFSLSFPSSEEKLRHAYYYCYYALHTCVELKATYDILLFHSVFHLQPASLTHTLVSLFNPQGPEKIFSPNVPT